MKIASTLQKIGLFLFSVLLSVPAWANQLQLRILETSDVQAQLTDYNYDTERNNPRYGYTRTASLLKKAQREVRNSMYVDNGNILQGTPIGDYAFNSGLEADKLHPSYMALHKMDAMATVVGQRELAHGLDYLDKAVAASPVPVLSANLFDVKSRAPRYKPYLFKIMNLTDNQGNKRRVNVAFLGLSSPNILDNQPSLRQHLLVSDVALTAKKYVPLLKKLGAEVIIALNHSETHQAVLSQIAGLDAVLLASELKPFGNEIGVLDLALNYDEATGKWQVANKKFEVRPIFDEATQKPLVYNNFLLKWRLRHHHNATRKFMLQSVGKTAQPLYSHLSLVQNDAATQLVQAAQKDFVQRELSTQPEWAKLPILSATAPYKTGKQHSQNDDFARIEVGDVSQRQLADLVPAHHTVAAVKVNGSELKEWLECSAGVFKQIQAATQKTQPLINWDFPTERFDVIDGVSYQFDLSQPAKYNAQCRVVNEKAQRVKQLQYRGKAVEPKSEFIVATHAQRALGGEFAGTGAKKVVLHSHVNTRQAVRDFIGKQSKNTHNQAFTQNKTLKNWQFAPVNAKVSFETAASEQAKAYVALEAVRPYQFTGQDLQGFHVYQFDLNK